MYYVVKTKALISCAVTVPLLFADAKKEVVLCDGSNRSWII